MTTIVLAEDHHVVRQGFKLVLMAEPDFKLIGEAADGLEAAQLAEKKKPNVLLLDLMIPRLHGLEVTRQVHRDSPATKIIILSMHADEPYVMEALRNGASGYVLKDCTAADLVETLYRGLADNSVGRVIDTLLRNEVLILDEVGFAPLDDTGTQLLFRLVAAAYERRSLAIASHWPFDQWGRFLPEHTTAASILDRLLHHATTVVTSGESYRMREARTTQGGHQNKS